jgi:hypothetical protein
MTCSADTMHERVTNCVNYVYNGGRI